MGALRPGYIYATLRTGTTGALTRMDQDGLSFLERVRALYSDKPAKILGGFGISTAAQVREVAPHVHAVVVGSALVREVAQGGNPCAAGLRRKMEELAGAAARGAAARASQSIHRVDRLPPESTAATLRAALVFSSTTDSSLYQPAWSVKTTVSSFRSGLESGSGSDLEYVKPRASQPAACKSLGKGCLIQDRAAGGIDEDRPGLHERELPGADHVPRLGSEGHVNGNVIGLCQQHGKLHGRGACGLDGGSAHVRIAHEHPAETQPRHFPQQACAPRFRTRECRESCPPPGSRAGRDGGSTFPARIMRSL